MKQPISVRWLANPNCAHSHFPHNFRKSHEYPIQCQSEDSELVNDHIGPAIMLTIASRMVDKL
jgi:hypothetical protein